MAEPQSPHSDDMRVFYASNPQGEVALDTIEVRHPAFVAEDGETPTAPRFVNDPDDFVAMLEDDAPLDAGALVTFKQGAFKITLPESASPGLPSALLEVANIGSELTDPMMAATSIPQPVKLTYRQYLASDPTTPGVIVDGLTARRSNINAAKVTAQLGYEDDLNTRFGRAKYTRERNPGLVR